MFDIDGPRRGQSANGFADGRDGCRVTGDSRDDGKVIEFKARVRLDTPQEVQYYRHGGILHYVLRQLLRG